MIIAIILAFLALVTASRWPRRVTWILFLLLPFQIALNPLPNIDLLAGRVAIPFVAVGVLFVLWRNKEPFRLSPVFWVALFLSGIGTASLLWSLNPIDAFQKSLLWWSLIPMIVLGEWLFSFSEERKRIPIMLSQLVFFVSIAALIPVVVSLFGGQRIVEELLRAVAPVLWGQGLGGEVLTHPSWFVDIGGHPFLRAFFPFPDPHMLAFFIATTLPFVVLRQTRFSYAVVVLGSLTLLATFSRGGYIGALVAFVIATLFIWRHFSFTFRRALVVIIALLVLMFVVSNPVNSRFWSAFDLSEGSVAGRTETMREAVLLIKQFPVSGVGLGQYASTLVPLSSSESPIYAHSSYLDVASELGVPTLLALVVAVLILFIRRYRFLFRFQYNPMQSAALIAFIWFSVHAIFETPIFSPRVLPYFFLVLVLLFSTFYKKDVLA